MNTNKEIKHMGNLYFRKQQDRMKHPQMRHLFYLSIDSFHHLLKSEPLSRHFSIHYLD